MDLSTIQKELKAPKTQFNSFGKYKYRSCEDILNAVKPLLGDMALVLDDEIVEIGGRIYVKATAKLIKGSEVIQATAYAREPLAKKGMDESQITGTASSYARKYALNGLFCIDDTKDADTMDNTIEPPENLEPNEQEQEVINLVYDKLLDSTPEGKTLNADKIGKFIFSIKNQYVSDKSKVGTIAAYIAKQIDRVCE